VGVFCWQLLHFCTCCSICARHQNASHCVEIEPTARTSLQIAVLQSITRWMKHNLEQHGLPTRKPPRMPWHIQTMPRAETREHQIQML